MFSKSVSTTDCLYEPQTNDLFELCKDYKWDDKVPTHDMGLLQMAVISVFSSVFKSLHPYLEM